MKKLKRFLAVISAAAVMMISMSGCENSSDSSSQTASSESSTAEVTAETSAEKTDSGSAVQLAASEEYSEYFTEFDLLTDYNNPTADIKLNGDSAQISGSGAVFENKTVTISSGGTYVLSGKLDDGQVYVDSEDDVHLVLNGAEISNSSSSPVFIENAGNVSITLADGTENILTDGAVYEYSGDEQNEPDAVIFSKDDLSINGNGSLTVNGNYNEGITTKNDLRIAGGNITVTSPGNGIKGKDSVVIQNAQINVNAGEDGIKSSNTEETDKGFIVFESGTFNIVSVNDAVQSENTLTVNGGELNIKSTGNGSGSTSETSGDTAQSENPFGDMYGGFGRGGMMDEGNTNKTEDSQKGLKSTKDIIINGGTINADCTDDSIHAGGCVEFAGGTAVLSSGDDGIHSDGTVNIGNAEIEIVSSYEGIEGSVINVNGGSVSVTSSDDGFNATDGETAGMGGMGGVSSSCVLNINGGSVYVNAGGDGLDSNGVMNINGGTIIVDGPEDSGNTALDSEAQVTVNGGVLIAAGSSGMLELPSDSSKQSSIVVTSAEQKAAGVPVCIKDENGTVLLSYTPAKTYSAVIISTPDIVSGSEYSIYSGGTVSGSAQNGYISGGSHTGGELVETVTVSAAVTTAGDGATGGMGGMKRGGGMGDFRSDGMIPQNGGETMTPPDDGYAFPAGGGDGMTPPAGGAFGEPA
ncbi:MAG: carbohydrate-binding domain-containing protein [Porcipelethomonas sp.]